MHPYSRASIASSFSNRALSLNGALGLLKSSVENFLKHPQASLVRRLITRLMSASSVMRPPRYTTWWTWWYFWSAAAISSAGRGGVGVSPGCCAFSGARIRRVFVSFFDTSLRDKNSIQLLHQGIAVIFKTRAFLIDC